MKGKKNILHISELHNSESLDEFCLFGCECSFPIHQFCHRIEKNFDIPLVRHIQRVAMTHSEQNDEPQAKNLLPLWENQTEEEEISYTYLDEGSNITHYVYPHRKNLFQNPIAIKEYGFVRYWWLVEGKLQNPSAFVEQVIGNMTQLSEVYFFEKMDMKRMIELPSFIFSTEKKTVS